MCRSANLERSRELSRAPEDLSALIGRERAQLQAAGWKATYGDTRCMLLGHLTRIAVNDLHTRWNKSLPTEQRLALVRDALNRSGNPDDLARRLADAPPPEEPVARSAGSARSEVEQVAIPF